MSNEEKLEHTHENCGCGCDCNDDCCNDCDEALDDEYDERQPEIVDLDGEPFEIIDGVNYKSTNFLALVPYKTDEELENDDSTEATFVVLKEVEENGEYYLATFDDDKELYEEVGELFLDRLNGEIGEDE